MKFKIIDDHPKDVADYTEVAYNDEEAKFVSNLRSLLESHPFPIVAKDIPIAWAVQVEDFAINKKYEIQMVRSVVNPLSPELGTAFGTFYYQKRISN